MRLFLFLFVFLFAGCETTDYRRSFPVSAHEREYIFLESDARPLRPHEKPFFFSRETEENILKYGLLFTTVLALGVYAYLLVSFPHVPFSLN